MKRNEKIRLLIKIQELSGEVDKLHDMLNKIKLEIGEI